jgi:tetratricopeptide (TPR) repeat protein
VDRGSKIGRFVVVTELGRGGMGAVYAAHDPQLDRQVAVKVLRHAESGGTGSDEEDRLRMMREGQAMARITHANVITVYEVGVEGELVFLAQELLDGGTLRSWLETPHSREEILEKFIAAGRGLAAAHAVGLVHRDFKPENVLLGKDGRVRVADFGLARAEAGLSESLATTQRGGGPPPSSDEMGRSPMSQLTQTGAVLGTPMFMAPEQHMGERADARSDQFAFCVSLYHALYKAWPFDGKTAVALADAVIEGRMAPVPKETASAVPASLRRILLRGLARYPGERYPTMQGLLADLEREVTPPRRSRAGLWATLGLVVAAGAAAGVYFVVHDRAASSASPAPAPLPPPPVDNELLTTEKGTAWLTSALDRGELDNAIEKYDLVLKGNIPAEQSAIALAAGAYMRVLRGELDQADAAIAEATKRAGTDPVARAYVDLAEAALAGARGQLPASRDRSKRCADALTQPAPALAAVCFELHGDALAQLGEVDAARAAYDAGAKLTPNAETLQLALAQLELDEGRTEQAGAIAAKVKAACADRGAIGCDVRAAVMLARIQIRAGNSAAALDPLATVKPATIEAFAVRTAYEIELGEVHSNMHETGEDNVLGPDRIEAARNDATMRGFVLLPLEARLAMLRVKLVDDAPDATDYHDALVRDAKAAGALRLVKLADAALQEMSDEPQGMLAPDDGGLPAVRTGSSGTP